MPEVADAYANKYGEVVEDFLSLVIIPSLAALAQKGVEIAAQEDQVHAAFHLHDHRSLITKTRMALCLGVQSLWEQQLREYLCNCPRKSGRTWMDIQRAHWGASGKVLSLNQLFSEIRGLRIEDFESYRRLDKLQLLGNVCRHGEGKSAEKLRMEYPELWPSAILDSGEYGLTPPAFMVLETMYISTTLLRDLVNAVQLFWLDLRIACTEGLISTNPTITIELEKLRARREPLV